MDDLETLFASTPVLPILKLPVVTSMPVGLELFCFGIVTAFLHTSLNADEPHLRVASGGILRREAHFVEVAESGLQLQDIGRVTSPHR